MEAHIKIRKAALQDAEQIHRAHMSSIKSICSKHYDADLIKAWGGREFNRDVRENAIENDYVWVVLKGETVEGFLHMTIGTDSAAIEGLYLSPNVSGTGKGNLVLKKAIDVCTQEGVEVIRLNSTVNARAFYERAGFSVREAEVVTVAGMPLNSYSMQLRISS